MQTQTNVYIDAKHERDLYRVLVTTAPAPASTLLGQICVTLMWCGENWLNISIQVVPYPRLLAYILLKIYSPNYSPSNSYRVSVCLVDLCLRSKKQLPTRFVFQTVRKSTHFCVRNICWGEKNNSFKSSKECYSIRVAFQKAMDDNKGR